MSPPRPPGPPLERPPRVDLSRTSIFADLDGTLARLEETPDLVGPNSARRELLQALTKAVDGRLAVVSGRGLDDLDRVLEGRVVALAGVHGLMRRRADGVVIGRGESPGLKETVSAFRAVAAAHPGVIVEDKTAAATLHFRLAPEAEPACVAEAEAMAKAHALILQPGKMVVEVRRPGPNKGDAVRAFMAEPPFAGSTPVFIGDDLTDEDGFAAAEALGGFGILVGDRRPTRARYALPGVEAALDWLRSLMKVEA